MRLKIDIDDALLNEAFAFIKAKLKKYLLQKSWCNKHPHCIIGVM